MNVFLDALTQMTNRSDFPEDIPEIKVPRNFRENMQWQCDAYNKTKGNFDDGYDCPDCLNRGYFLAIKDDVIVQSECKCMSIRRSLIRLKNSGLGDIARQYTFDAYETRSEWQKKAKAKAERYVAENPEKWLFCGGQSGCGKTHLCTAVCMELINQGHDVKYILWRDIVHSTEQNRFNEGNFRKKFQEMQNVEILYIDDFLKTTHRVNGKIVPSETELNTAYEIINSRVISGKKTIISSELHINDISQLDEATGGRISAASKGFQIQINFEANRNSRFYGR